MYWGIFCLLTIYSSIAKSEPVSVLGFFCFSPKTPFFFFTSQKNSQFVVRFFFPLSNRIPIKSISEFYHIFHLIKKIKIIIQISSFQHLAKNITHSVMANRIVWVQKIGKQNINQPDITTNIPIVNVSISFSQHKSLKR